MASLEARVDADRMEKIFSRLDKSSVKGERKIAGDDGNADMSNWPHDDTASKNAFYGDFRSPGWQDLHLVHMIPPFTMYYSKQALSHGLLVHKLIVNALQGALNEIWDKCNHDQTQVDK